MGFLVAIGPDLVWFVNIFMLLLKTTRYLSLLWQISSYPFAKFGHIHSCQGYSVITRAKTAKKELSHEHVGKTIVDKGPQYGFFGSPLDQTWYGLRKYLKYPFFSYRELVEQHG